MKVGDTVTFNDHQVRWASPPNIGIAVRIDDSHQQVKVDVLFSDGLVTGIWEGHLKVIVEQP